MWKGINKALGSIKNQAKDEWFDLSENDDDMKQAIAKGGGDLKGMDERIQEQYGTEESPKEHPISRSAGGSKREAP